MTELETLATRLDEALSALESGAAQGDASAAASREITRLQQENAQLTEDLAALKAARSKDLAELDELITQLKPLVGESA